MKLNVGLVIPNATLKHFQLQRVAVECPEMRKNKTLSVALIPMDATML
ncbi:MAG: hypothetical protein AAGC95_14130 [Pseudomonadota bacterium]